MSEGYVFRINVNPEGGVPKYRVAEAEITPEGVVGDRQLDLECHGGPERAVSLFSHELILALRAEGHPIDCGTTGENLTIAGLDWSSLGRGSCLRIGEVLLEVTSFAAPCRTIAASFFDGNSNRIGHKPHPGWSRLYARVLREGTVREGDAVREMGR